MRVVILTLFLFAQSSVKGQTPVKNYCIVGISCKDEIAAFVNYTYIGESDKHWVAERAFMYKGSDNDTLTIFYAKKMVYSYNKDSVNKRVEFISRMTGPLPVMYRIFTNYFGSSANMNTIKQNGRDNFTALHQGRKISVEISKNRMDITGLSNNFLSQRFPNDLYGRIIYQQLIIS
jgi:hypothetical protein